MAASKEVSVEVFPYIRVYKDGSLERLAGTDVAPAGLDPATDVLSKDILILPETGVSARLYRPASTVTKLPLVVYFHGGAFIIASPADPFYHGSLNALAAAAKAVILAVDYRLCPEHPLPAAYDDCWAALQWVATQATTVTEPWLHEDLVDFNRIFLVGDSGGANMCHHLALRRDTIVPIAGVGMIHPYFWGEEPIGIEVSDVGRKAMVDSWWKFVCPSEKGCDDPLINPFAEAGEGGLDKLGCEKVVVFVAEKDILRDRGKLYYDKLIKSGWQGKADLVQTDDVDHVFHIFDPASDKANALFQTLASFINHLP